MSPIRLQLTSLLSACVWLTLTLTSCGSSDGPFRLEGRLRNMNQAEFYIYHVEQGWKDTIAVRDGRFSYEIALSDTITLRLMFPNYSELPIFARPGAELKLEGDASHLRGTEVTGTEENEEMTGFRLRANNMHPPEVRKAAEEYILAHPTSPVSYYLYDSYFLMTPSPDYELAEKLGAALLKASPENGQLVRQQKQLKGMAATVKGKKLPAFTATDTEGKTVSDSLLKADVNVVLLWASWSMESKSMLQYLRRQQKEHSDKLAAVTICLDAKSQETAEQFKSDGGNIPVICDGQMWQSPLVMKLGFATLPACIITDKSGKILTRQPAKQHDLKEELTKLLK